METIRTLNKQTWTQDWFLCCSYTAVIYVRAGSHHKPRSLVTRRGLGDGWAHTHHGSLPSRFLRFCATHSPSPTDVTDLILSFFASLRLDECRQATESEGSSGVKMQPAWRPGLKMRPHRQFIACRSVRIWNFEAACLYIRMGNIRIWFRQCQGPAR